MYLLYVLPSPSASWEQMTWRIMEPQDKRSLSPRITSWRRELPSNGNSDWILTGVRNLMVSQELCEAHLLQQLTLS